MDSLNRDLIEGSYKLETKDKFIYINKLVSFYSLNFHNGAKELSFCFILLIYMIVDLLVLNSINLLSSSFPLLLLKYSLLANSYYSFLKNLLNGFKKLIASESIPPGQKMVLPQLTIEEDILTSARRYRKNNILTNGIVWNQENTKKIIVGCNYISEFSNLPQIVLNSTRAQSMMKEAFGYIDPEKYRRLACSRFICYFTSSHYLSHYLSKAWIIFESELKQSIYSNSLKLEEGQFQINNVENIFQKAISTTILFRFFDETIVGNSETLQKLSQSIENSPQYGLKNKIFEALKFERIGIFAKKRENKPKFADIVKAMFAQLLQSKGDSNSVIQFILENQKLFDIRNVDFLSNSIIGMIKLAQLKLNDNFKLVFLTLLTKVSLKDELYYEQQTLVKKYGRKMNMQIIDEMSVLDAAIKESLRVTLSIYHIPRHVSKKVVLSNGTTIPQGSYVGFNAYSQNKSQKFFGVNGSEFDHTRHLKSGRSLLDDSSENLIWSVGPRMCVGREFSAYFLKMAYAIIIRKYSFEPLYSSRESVHNPSILLPSAKGAIFSQRHFDL